MHFKNINEHANICNKLNFKRLNFYIAFKTCNKFDPRAH